LAGVTSGLLAVLGAYIYVKDELPSVENLRDVRLQVPLRIYSADNALIAEFGEMRRIPIGFAETPPRMIQAFLAAEDDSFFRHQGVDLAGLLRAGFKLALTGQKLQGGSTITMQVARNYYLTPERTFVRKIREIFLAMMIERELSKEEIFSLYLNKIYLGNRAYGIGAAAQIYYGKTLDELSLAETAMIAGLPKAPSRYNPIADPERALERRDWVLGRMQELGFIREAELQAARAEPDSAQLRLAEIELDAPYLAEMARQEMVERFGNDAYTNGYSVYTTLTSAPQRAAAAALRSALDAYDRRHGWRGAEGHLDRIPETSRERDQLLGQRSVVGELQPAVVIEVRAQEADVYLQQDRLVTLDWEGLKWARPHISEDRLGAAPKKAEQILAPGDLIRVQAYLDDKAVQHWRLAAIPEVAGALISLRASDGAVLALTGGYSFYQSKFNRVIQAHRQPGSGFKPFIYSAALEAGFTPASIINDAPVVVEDTSLEGAWRPENYSGEFFGPTRLREALTHSRNLVSIRLLRGMNMDHAMNHIANFGFSPEQLPRNLSLALGSGVVTPWQMARGYAVLANGGFLVDPYFIARIEEEGKGVIFQADPVVACPDCEEPAEDPAPVTTPTPPEVAAASAAMEQMGPAVPRPAPRTISAENRFLMYSMMQDVIRRGTGQKAKALGRQDLAGKTGTSNDQRDAWFNGFNQEIVTNVWVGFDDNRKLGRGEVGGRAALPAWIDYMRVALADSPEVAPAIPAGIVTVRIDPRSGLLAPAGMRDAIFEVFQVGRVPQETSTPEATSNQSPDQPADTKPTGLGDIF